MSAVRVFLSSPGDLIDERGIALSVIDELRYEPEIPRSVDLEAIAWDDLGSGKPVFATETPQDSLNRGKRRPADCDVVVVMFWGRFGTALSPSPRRGLLSADPLGHFGPCIALQKQSVYMCELRAWM